MPPALEGRGCVGDMDQKHEQAHVTVEFVVSPSVSQLVLLRLVNLVGTRTTKKVVLVRLWNQTQYEPFVHSSQLILDLVKTHFPLSTIVPK